MNTRAVFVQIPAYRDRELPITLRDLFERARHPERLHVHVAWQYHKDELCWEREFRRWPNLSLLKIPAANSEGCNWARELLQARYSGEPYTLLLDSHHRFAADWDELAIDMFEALRASGVRKPILTGYLPPYDPHTDPSGRAASVYEMRALERREGMLFRLVADAVPGWSRLIAPIPARYASLHWLFADGAFNRELAIDSSIYFFVDEIAIALRAYTSGYDLFHPHRILGWHSYARSTRVAHWDDHASWREQNAVSLKRVRALFRGRLQGRYGIGTVRTVTDYEALLGEPLIARSER